MPAKKVSQKVADDLFMIHNPFAGTTTQPKIPDGKVNDSLGHTTTEVFELKNGDGADTINILLYAGRCGMMIWEGGQELGVREFNAQHFEGSGAVDWSTGTFADLPGGEGFNILDPEQYGMWRIVSAGMQLKLLNALEEDDGWWEAIRVSEAMDSDRWALTTGDNADASEIPTKGLVVPLATLKNVVKDYDLPNDPTYSTGLLRDLHRVQFELHGRLDYHDFTTGKSTTHIEGGDAGIYFGASADLGFNSGRDSVHEMIDNFVDKSYDMVYIRLHCRPNDERSEGGKQGSRFHCHLVSNQEIYFPGDARENRYQTKTDTIGSHLCSLHFQGRRAMGNAATLIE